MFANKRLTEVFESSEVIPFDDSSKFILFSDCHRGDNSWADDLAHNQNIFFHALKEYNKQKFTYIEIGDGDELWENKHFEDIRKSYDHIFWRMGKFHKDNRLYLIWGNHNRKWKNPKKVKNNLYEYNDEREKNPHKPLFKNIKVHEGLVLQHSVSGKKILILHGHQADLLNDRLWWFSRFIVRHAWKPLQLIGFRDPTSPAKNHKKRKKIEAIIQSWIKENNQMVICGHTHRPVLLDVDKPPYFNTGSCVHPRCITGIEIQNGEISLIKWFIESNDEGVLCIKKDYKVEPKKLSTYWNKDHLYDANI